MHQLHKPASSGTNYRCLTFIFQISLSLSLSHFEWGLVGYDQMHQLHEPAATGTNERYFTFPFTLIGLLSISLHIHIQTTVSSHLTFILSGSLSLS